ncbi:MAG: sugar phosphate isomerase/epimerase family protein [Candidatus Hydrogenedentota bacterium]
MSSIKSCVTISLVEQARSGPFVFHDDFEQGCVEAAKLGFDAVELFAPDSDAIAMSEVLACTAKHGLELAAVGTGAGMVIQGLSISDEADSRRASACDFVRSMIDYGAQAGVPAIIGSMQGEADSAEGIDTAKERLVASLMELGSYAREKGQMLLMEPLNRYESNLCNTLADAVALIEKSGSPNVKILADLFHMNIEEVDVAQSIRDAADYVGHVHFADSNRKAIGFGHADIAPIAAALKEIGFSGYASAEVFAQPNSIEAAAQTKRAFDACFG